MGMVLWLVMGLLYYVRAKEIKTSHHATNLNVYILKLLSKSNKILNNGSQNKVDEPHSDDKSES